MPAPLILSVLGADVPFWDDPGGERPDEYEGKDYADDPWDYVELNGQGVPGVSVVKCTPRVRLKTNKTVGRDGGPTIEEGHEAAKVEIAIKIWTPSQWRLLQRLLRQIWRRPGAPYFQTDDKTRAPDKKTGLVPKVTRPAITIEHPACAMWGVFSILIESPDSPEPAPEIGAKIIRLRAVQYIAKSIEATRKASGTGKRGTLAPSSKDPKGTPVAPPPSTTGAAFARPPVPGAAGPIR